MLFFLFAAIERACFSIRINASAIEPKSVVPPCCFYVSLEKDIPLKFNYYGKIQVIRTFGIALANL